MTDQTKKEYYENYCMNGADNSDMTITITSDDNLSYDGSSLITDLIDIGAADINLDWNDIHQQRNLIVEGDVVIKNYGEDPIDVYNTICEQKLQIEALTDIIQEMVEKKDFNIDWDLNKRVEQKRFLQKLAKDA